MKRICLLVILFSGLLSPIRGGEIRDFFKEMPDSLLPLLTHANRLDLLDFAASNMRAEVKNVYGDKTVLSALQGNYLRLDETAATTLELLLLPQRTDTLIVAVRTFKDPINQSVITVWKSDWTRLQTESFVRMPELKDFLVLPAGKTEEERSVALGRADLPVVSANVDAKDASLHFKIDCYGGFLDVQEDLQPYIRPELIYHWNGQKFQ